MKAPLKAGYEKLLRTVTDKIAGITGGIDLKFWLLKFLPLAGLQACAVFTYTAVKNAKNSIFIRHSDATVFTYLKIIVIMPIALLFPYILRKVTEFLGNRRQKVPYVLIGAYIVFYLFFGFVLIPLEKIIQFPWLTDLLLTIKWIPVAVATGLGDTFGYWAESLFYGLSELWSSIGINYIAWGIANEICAKNETTIFYPMFGLLTNLAAVQSARMIADTNLSGLSGDTFASTIQSLVITLVIALGVMIAIYYCLERFVMNNPKYVTKKEPKVKTKPSESDGLAMVLKSPYLRSIALMLIGYSLSIVLFEQCWYESIRTGYGKHVYTAVSAKTTEINAIMTMIMTALGVFVLNRFPWIVRAMLPVVMMGLSGIVFMLIFIFGDNSALMALVSQVGFVAVPPTLLAVIIGSLQNIASRSTKYSLFDSTKEQLFSSSPDEDIRTKGKAAVDVTVARLGKSGASAIALVLLIIQPMFVSFFSSVVGLVRGNSEMTQEIEARPAVQPVKANSTDTIKSMFTVTDDQITIDPKKAANDFKVQHNTDGTMVLSPKTKNNQTVEVQNVSTVQPEVKPKKVLNKDIAPALLIIVILLLAGWVYAVLTIAPEYEMNVIDSDSPADRKKALQNGSFNLKNLSLLIVLAVVICGSLYFWVSTEINQIIIKTNAIFAMDNSNTIDETKNPNIVPGVNLQDANADLDEDNEDELEAAEEDAKSAKKSVAQKASTPKQVAKPASAKK